MDLIELTSLMALDMEALRKSLSRTNKMLDESPYSGGMGATVSAVVGELCFDLLDAPAVRRLCMTNAPVPYASWKRPL